jgi:RimJ/RimL family protein N-acetyltransferase
MEYRKIIEIEVRDFTREVFEKTWEWLSDPQVKELTASPDFDKESSEEWFESLKTRNDYMVKSVWHNNKPIAILGLKHINGKDGETLGYIGEKEYWGKTIGAQGLEYIIEYGRSLNLESIYSVIVKKNISSYKLNRRLGFVREEDKDENNIVMRYYY